MGQLAVMQEQQGQMNQRLTQLLQQGHQLPPTTTTTTTTAATAKNGGGTREGRTGGKDAWAKTALLGRFLAREEEKGDKEQAIAALQRLADSAGKKGNSKSPDWKEVLRRLRNTDEEKKRKTEIEEERESKKAKKAAGSGSEEE